MIRSRRFTITVALSLAAALSLSGLAVLAAPSRGSVHPSVNPSTVPEIRRAVVWFGVPASTPRALHIESSSINAPSADEFQITYADGNFTLTYQRAAGGPITSQYTLSVLGILEWNDTHGDGQIEDGTMVAYTALGPGAFGRYPIQHTETRDAGGIGIYSFQMLSNQGDLALNLTITDGFLTLPSGHMQTPMEAKLTLDIRHNMTLPDTLLAVHMGLSTDQKVVLENRSWDDEHEFSSDDRALNVTNDAIPASSSAFFSWSNSASVNGQVGPVTPSGPSVNATTGDHEFYLSYVRPATGDLQLHVVHDPAMGVVSVAYTSSLHPGPGAPLPFVGDAFLYGISLAGIAALVGATAILVNRRRRKGP